MAAAIGLLAVACQAQPVITPTAADTGVAQPSPLSSQTPTATRTASHSATPVESATPVASVIGPPSTMAPRPLTLTVGDQPQTVFDWHTQRCVDDELADLPARAIRTADDMVSLYLSSTTSYRLVGRDFNSLTPDCAPVLTSAFDRNPADFEYGEWLGSPYTLDGQTVYDIVHEEYHGDRAGSVWQASRDFAGQQPAGAWRYLDWNGSNYRPMTTTPPISAGRAGNRCARSAPAACIPTSAASRFSSGPARSTPR